MSTTEKVCLGYVTEGSKSPTPLSSLQIPLLCQVLGKSYGQQNKSRLYKQDKTIFEWKININFFSDTKQTASINVVVLTENFLL